MQIDHEAEGIMLTRRTPSTEFRTAVGGGAIPDAGDRRIFCAITSITEIGVDAAIKAMVHCSAEVVQCFWIPQTLACDGPRHRTAQGK